MGELKVIKPATAREKAVYIKQLIRDIEALELLIDNELIEKDPIRIGAEQEFCLIDENAQPCPEAMGIMQGLNDPHFTNEIALYNLEANLDPIPLTGSCFSQMHKQLVGLLQKADDEAKKINTRILLTGILPTITSKHLELPYMTPKERYSILNEAIKEIRGDEFELHIKGVDEINLKHNSILFEGCNTSFQMHLQINPDDFVDSYNWAQAISGPVLAACTNAPLLLGKELWSETRIALFTQSVDTRSSSFLLNEKEARVGFGNDWEKGSAATIFKDSIVRFRSLVSATFEEDSMAIVKRGEAPKLKALNLHNGTVYKWNRPCYGVGNGKAHLRIENRYIPSGPSTTDEIANMVFWVGIMRGRPQKYKNIHEQMDFKDAKSNFFNAARYGMATRFYWDGELISSEKLILDELLPMAYRGLYSMKVNPKDVEHYLTIIENRVKNLSGSRWMVESFRNLKKHNKTPEALRILTEEIYRNQEKAYPIATWQVIESTYHNTKKKNKTVREQMNTYIYNVHEKDSVRLVLNTMKWKNIHHVPVVNNKMELKGLLTWTDVKSFLNDDEKLDAAVETIMKKTIITIAPDDPILKASKLMKENNINSLPVLKNQKIIGIITSKDISV
ncbi:CBS domain-containing protein [Leptobacterium sp. I13]|uniref:CBS domain-containing protein n=1 Tax=Leptobacterium meishanense TaxID=3128904 RepID=UPI0030ED61C9